MNSLNLYSKPVDQSTSGVLTQTEGYNVSDRYRVVTSQGLVDRLQSEGYEINGIVETKPRKASKLGFQKHMLRISRPDLNIGIDGLRPEIVIVNSYDRSTSLQIMLGIFRMVCSNGLIAGTSYQSYRVRHVGSVLDNALVALDNVKTALPKIGDQIKRFQNIQLTEDQATGFSNEIAKQLIQGKQNVEQYNSTDLLGIRRTVDKQQDLFTVLNVIQENAIRGGMRYTSKTWDEKRKQDVLSNRRLRAIKAIDKQTKVNQLVWDQAEKIAA